MRIPSAVLAALSASVLVVACGSDGSSSGSPREGGVDNGAAPSCAQVCPGIVAPHCPGGPANEADCESGCQTIRSGKCAAAYGTLYQCAGATPTYTCGSAIGVIVNGCENQSAALTSCLTSP
jgi:hypothetical protein